MDDKQRVLRMLKFQCQYFNKRYGGLGLAEIENESMVVNFMATKTKTILFVVGSTDVEVDGVNPYATFDIRRFGERELAFSMKAMYGKIEWLLNEAKHATPAPIPPMPDVPNLWPELNIPEEKR